MSVPSPIADLWLLDVSGSMRGQRFEILKEAVLRHAETVPNVKLLAFSTTIYPLKSLAELDRIIPNGGTNLHLALDYAAQNMAASVIVFTDGEPNDAEMCYEAAAKIPGIVHTIFCGHYDDAAAIEFCERLSGDNGGRTVVKDVLNGQSLLGTDIKELLGLPSPLAL